MKTPSFVHKALAILGMKIIRISKDPVMDYDADFIDIYDKCRNHTMTSKERMFSLYQAVQYVVRANIRGDFVECGVWRGGSSMLIAMTLLKMGVTDRKIFLYDTFDGMSIPTNDDHVLGSNKYAKDSWNKHEGVRKSGWCRSDLDEVKSNMAKTQYPERMLIFVQGKVEETIPMYLPEAISLLRLDTDWYESTKHELHHLFPLLASHGVLIIDDYGYWAGSKKAVDEYLVDKPLLLHRIDPPSRIGIKVT